MKKIIITESQLEKLIDSNKTSEMEEGVFDSLKDVYHGVRGIYKGYGYDYFKYSSALKNVARDIQNDYEAVFTKNQQKLDKMKSKLTNANFVRKNDVEGAISDVERLIRSARNKINNIDNELKNVLR